MTNSFKILWFEDEINWFNMEQRHIVDILENHCLVPEITRKIGDDFKLSDICTNCYDLILMDFALVSITGDKIGSAIRKNNVLTDILFYSSQEDAMLSAIRNAVPPIDGIYYTKRDNDIFTEKVRGLICKIVRRSEDLINLRGFVMDSSCDFEVRVEALLSLAWNKFTCQERTELETAVKTNIEGKEKNFAKKKDQVVNNEFVFPAALAQPHFLNHSDRLFLLNKVISILQLKYGLSNAEEYSRFKMQYEADISHYRNALGHRKSGETVIEVTKGAFEKIDEALHQKMRKNLSRYDKLISQLEIFITEQI